MALRTVIATITALTASAGAGGAYLATRTTTPGAEPTKVMVETKEAPADQNAVQVESGGSKHRVEVRRDKSGDGKAGSSEVHVETGGKKHDVSVQRGENGDKDVKTGNVHVQRKKGTLNVKVGDLGVAVGE